MGTIDREFLGMKNDSLDVKIYQANVVKDQCLAILKNTSLSEDEQQRAAVDIAEVILTSWNMREADVLFGNTEFGDQWASKN